MKLKYLFQEKLYLILVTFLLWTVQGQGWYFGRYKLIKMLGGNLEINNVSKSMKKIFDMSGVSRIIMVKQKDESKMELDNSDNTETKIEKNMYQNTEKEEQDEGVI